MALLVVSLSNQAHSQKPVRTVGGFDTLYRTFSHKNAGW